MKFRSSDGGIQLRDNDGETVIMRLSANAHDESDPVELTVSQFKGVEVEWQKTISTQYIIDLVKKHGKPE